MVVGMIEWLKTRFEECSRARTTTEHYTVVVNEVGGWVSVEDYTESSNGDAGHHARDKGSRSQELNAEEAWPTPLP